MKVKILSSNVSRVENGVRKTVGDIIDITKKEYNANASAYAPLRVNVKVKDEPRTEEDVPSYDNA